VYTSYVFFIHTFDVDINESAIFRALGLLLWGVLWYILDS
jgi:hypothetical protein